MPLSLPGIFASLPRLWACPILGGLFLRLRLGVLELLLWFLSFSVSPPWGELPPLRTLARTAWRLLLCTLSCYGSILLVAWPPPIFLSFCPWGFFWLFQILGHWPFLLLYWFGSGTPTWRQPPFQSAGRNPWTLHCQNILCCRLWCVLGHHNGRQCFAKRTFWLMWSLRWLRALPLPILWNVQLPPRQTCSCPVRGLTCQQCQCLTAEGVMMGRLAASAVLGPPSCVRTFDRLHMWRRVTPHPQLLLANKNPAGGPWQLGL
jgi:hypothetical protein